MTSEGVFEATVSADVLRLRRPATEWLSTGYGGGRRRADAAYNVSVPDGWTETDLDAYVRRRRRRAGFDGAGPTLLTGVALKHARRARLGPVEAVATAGVSNPAALPVGSTDTDSDSDADGDPSRRPPGTVNVVVGTTRSLSEGALANLVAVVAEAKAATLLAKACVPGTTTDAVVVGTDPAGDPAEFSGSATEVGAAARACVRDAILAALDSRYADRPLPTSVDDAEYGVVTDERADVSRV